MAGELNLRGTRLRDKGLFWAIKRGGRPLLAGSLAPSAFGVWEKVGE